MNKKDYIINKSTNEILKLREHISRLDPNYYNKLVENDKKYCKSLGHDIRMRIKLKSKS